MNTDLNHADVLTKVLSRIPFMSHISALMGLSRVENTVNWATPSVIEGGVGLHVPVTRAW